MRKKRRTTRAPLGILLMAAVIRLCCQPGLFTGLAARLEPYKLPRRIVQLAQLPRTYNGKLDRKQLKNYRPD